jgi:hypothetical protein
MRERRGEVIAVPDPVGGGRHRQAGDGRGEGPREARGYRAITSPRAEGSPIPGAATIIPPTSRRDGAARGGEVMAKGTSMRKEKKKPKKSKAK